MDHRACIAAIDGFNCLAGNGHGLVGITFDKKRCVCLAIDLGFERSGRLKSTPIGGARQIEHKQLPISKAVTREPALGGLAILFKAAGHQCGDFINGLKARFDAFEKRCVPRAVVVFRRQRVTTKDAVDIDARVAELGAVQKIPLEGAGQSDGVKMKIDQCCVFGRGEDGGKDELVMG